MRRNNFAIKLARTDLIASLGLALIMSAPVCADDDPPHRSLLILTSEKSEEVAEPDKQESDTELDSQEASEEFVLDDQDPTGISKSKEVPPLGDELEVETIYERFPNGTVRVERQIALDVEGNYVNHGTYQEWNDKSQLIMSGEYRHGKRQGQWLQFIFKPTSGILISMPYAEFEPPFTSEADFRDDLLHGSWKIADSKGRIASNLDFDNGLRHGVAAWYFVSGKPFFQSQYLEGLMEGEAYEYNKDGSEKRHDTYVKGQRVEVKKEWYKENRPRTEYECLTPTQMVKALDDWSATKMAKYEAHGDYVKNGKFTTWHENGNIRAEGSYNKNELDGDYQSWHPSGDRESSGHFKVGLMHGPWSWWHPNGMKRAAGTYIDGTPQGNWRAWNADGKLVNQEHFDRSELEVPTLETVAQERTARTQHDIIR